MLSIDMILHRGILKKRPLYRSSPVLPLYLKQGLIITVKFLGKVNII